MTNIKPWHERSGVCMSNTASWPHIEAEIAELRAALQHAEWCAEVNRDGREEEVAELRAALNIALAVPVDTSDIVVPDPIYCLREAMNNVGMKGAERVMLVGHFSMAWNARLGTSGVMPLAQMVAVDDRKVADTVNELQHIAIKFHDAQQLRERIAHVIVPLLKRVAAVDAQGKTL